MYQIVSDGSCDLSQDIILENNIHVVDFYICVDGLHHQRERTELSVDDFYQYMIDHPDVFPKTSMPSIEDYTICFEEILKRGEDILCFCITTKFSGSYNSANNAKNMLLEKYPDRKIEIIDSTLATVLQGLFVLEGCKLKNQGKSLDETVKILEKIKVSGRIFFTVGNFEYLIHGGRIGKVAGVAARTLGIRPIIVMQEGEIFSKGVTRGRIKSKKKTIEALVDYLHECKSHPSQYSICVGYGYDYEEGKKFLEELKTQLKKEFPDYDDEVMICHIGATIGVHTGPYPIGLGIIEKV